MRSSVRSRFARGLYVSIDSENARIPDGPSTAPGRKLTPPSAARPTMIASMSGVGSPDSAARKGCGDGGRTDLANELREREDGRMQLGRVEASLDASRFQTRSEHARQSGRHPRTGGAGRIAPEHAGIRRYERQICLDVAEGRCCVAEC